MKNWQEWLQFALSVVIIPVLGIFCYQVFQNKADLAVMESRQSNDHEMIKEIRDDLKDLNRFLRTFELADK